MLETEIAADNSRQGWINIRYEENFGVVGIKAPVGSSIRIICEEPNSNPKRYTRCFEEIGGVTGTACITVWINRLCYIQGESGNSLFLEPQTPDSDFPSNVSATVVANRDLQGSNSSVSSFKFKVKTSNNGPVFPRHSTGLDRCRFATGVLHFFFSTTPHPAVLTSQLLASMTSQIPLTGILKTMFVSLKYWQKEQAPLYFSLEAIVQINRGTMDTQL